MQTLTAGGKELGIREGRQEECKRVNSRTEGGKDAWKRVMEGTV